MAVCPLQAKVYAPSTGLLLSLSLPRKKSVVRLNDHLDMTITVDWDIEPQTKPKTTITDHGVHLTLKLTLKYPQYMFCITHSYLEARPWFHKKRHFSHC